MPTYQYACTECGERLEAVQSFSDPALTDCPACQGRLRKVFNSVGVVFKGSGFYRTDSRKGNGDSSSSSSGGETKKGEAKKPETKTESAPAAKTESKPAASTTSTTS